MSLLFTVIQGVKVGEKSAKIDTKFPPTPNQKKKKHTNSCKLTIYWGDKQLWATNLGGQQVQVGNDLYQKYDTSMPLT